MIPIKQETRPTRKQKEEIANNGLNWRNWLVERDVPSKLIVVHRESRNVRELKRGG